MDEESILSIMNMVKEGIISPKEAVELVKALIDKPKNSENARKSKKKMLVIHVTPKGSKGEKANIAIPLGMAKVFLKRFGIDKGMDINLEDVKENGIHVETEDEIVDVRIE